jgi:hypothetical protein
MTEQRPTDQLPRSEFTPWADEEQGRTMMHEISYTEQRSWHRAITAKALSHLHGETEAEKILRDHFPNDSRAKLILRAAVSPMGRTDFPTFSPTEAFRSLAPGSAAFALFDRALKINLTGKTSVKVPYLATLTPNPVFIPEKGAIPVEQTQFGAMTVGPTRRVRVIAVFTRELNEATPETAASAIGKVLSDRMLVSIDKAAFGNQADDGTTPIGLLNGATVVTASTASDVANAMAEDLAGLADAIGAKGIDTSDIVYICGPREATLIKARMGPMFDNLVLPTLGLPTAKMVAAIAPNAVAFGYDGPPKIETSEEGELNMASPALEIVNSGGTVSVPTGSLYQKDSVGIKVTANCAWCCVPGAAATVSSISWLSKKEGEE